MCVYIHTRHTNTQYEHLPFSAGGARGVGAALLRKDGFFARERAIIETVRHVHSIFLRVPYLSKKKMQLQQ